MRYQFVQGLKNVFSLEALCAAMKVSTSGFRAWSKRPKSERERENEILTEHLRDFFEKGRQVSGSLRLWRDVQESKELQELGIRAGKNRVARLMQKAGLRASAVPKFVVTTDSNHTLPIAENLLNQDFGAEQADVKWASDITYIPTREGWLYLSVVLDLFSRRIVGWCMSASLDRSLVVEALQMALKGRSPSAGLIHHSDRGSQYASGDFQKVLEGAGIRCSMSRRGNCWDNASVESFLGTLKKELVHRYDFASRACARSTIFEWLEVFYNRSRRHWSPGYLSPVEFERRANLESLQRAASAAAPA
jgi:transposase InsO family protein